LKLTFVLVIVIIEPDGMTTRSPLDGTTPPDQDPELFHSPPVDVAVIVEPKEFIRIKSSVRNVIDRFIIFLARMASLFKKNLYISQNQLVAPADVKNVRGFKK